MIVIDPSVWLNRIGIFLNILALVLASPELFGERPLRVANAFTLSILRFVLGVARRILNVKDIEELVNDFPETLKIFNQATVGRKLLAIFLLLVGLGLIIGSVLYIVFVQTPATRIVTILTITLAVLVILIVPRWISALTDSTYLRKFWLRIGGVFFLAGSVLQLVSTFVS